MKFKEFNELYNHKCSEEKKYVMPKDQNVLQSLEDFKDKKFGLMMHWGLYSQLGIIESWALPDQDRSWAWGGMEKYQHMTGAEFRQMYFDLIKQFNPTKFDPDKWAVMAKDAGFKYYILTTKHHDGFCLWDTKYTDFKVTSPQCPFSNNKNADIIKATYDAFRKQGIAINTYFSKADWHSEFYWPDGFARKEFRTRMTTYNVITKRKIWKKFVQFTRNQMLELVSNYGKIDCLWLDGGQVSPAHSMGIGLSKIMKEARKIQPGLLVADRTIGGRNENLLTPEQSVPDHIINVPWESCLTLGTAFSYRENDTYKDARTVINLLCNIVAKGGNLALNIAPDGLGDIPDEVLLILKDIGEWMSINGDAIYGTRPIAPYACGNIVYTAKNDSIYAIYLIEKDEVLKDKIALTCNKKATKVTCKNQGVAFTQDGSTLTIDTRLCDSTQLAVVFEIS